jgi:hypothetical protein
MSAIQFYWTNAVQARLNFDKMIEPWCRAHMMAGRSVVGEIRLHEDVKSDAQRRYLHGVVLTQIAQQVSTDGRKYGLPVWKEFFRSMFLGYRTLTFINPITGKKSRRRERKSTEKLTLKAYAEYTEKITAYAVTELGVNFDPAYTETIDPETGEIYQK